MVSKLGQNESYHVSLLGVYNYNKWDKTSTKNAGSYLINSLKLLHDQTHVKFLVHRYFRLKYTSQK